MIKRDSHRALSLGKLKKGAPKEQGLKDLDYWRFEPDKRNPWLKTIFEQAYGKTPRSINIFLPYATPEENYEDWYEEWGKNYMKARCNGETIVQHLPPQSSDYSFCPMPCKKPACGCDDIGRLTVYIVEFFALGHLGTVTVETHSINDQIHISSQLTQVAGMMKAIAKPTGLIGSRFHLERVEETIGVPAFKKGQKGAIPGVRSTADKWLINLRPDEEWIQEEMRRSHARTLQGAMPDLMLMGQQNMLPAAGMRVLETPGNVQAKLAAAPVARPIRVEVMADRNWSAIKEWTQLTSDQIKAIATSANLPTSPAKLNEDESEQLRDLLFVHAAVNGDRFASVNDAFNALNELRFKARNVSDEVLWEEWTSQVWE